MSSSDRSPDPGSKPGPAKSSPGTPRTVVITGGGRGIGAAIAQAFAGRGDRVVVSSRTRTEIEEVAKDLRSTGGEAVAFPCDVQDPAMIAELVASVHAEFGAIDILINNAGVGHAAPLKKTTLEDWNRVFAVNATGTMLCLQACLPDMIGSGWGRVVNIASVAGLAGGRYISAYSASKHAVLGLTRSVAAETTGTGVTVNAVCPGYVDTPMTHRTVGDLQKRSGLSAEEALAAILQTTRQPRLVRPDEVAAVVQHLCSDGAASIHGQSIVIDGGGLQF